MGLVGAPWAHTCLALRAAELHPDWAAGGGKPALLTQQLCTHGCTLGVGVPQPGICLGAEKKRNVVGSNRKSHPRSLHQRRLQDPTHHGGWRVAGSEHRCRRRVTPCSTRLSPGDGQCLSQPTAPSATPSALARLLPGAHRALGAAGKGARILPSALRPPGLSIAMTSARTRAGPGRASSLLGRATASAPTRHRTAAKPRLLSRTFANPAGFDVRGCPREAHKGRFQGCSAKRWRTPAGKGRRRCWVSPR